MTFGGCRRALFGHTDGNPNELCFLDSGSGGPDEFASRMDDTQYLYGLRKFSDGWQHIVALLCACGVCVCVYVRACVCVCVCDRERESVRVCVCLRSPVCEFVGVNRHMCVMCDYSRVLVCVVSVEASPSTLSHPPCLTRYTHAHYVQIVD